MALLDFACLESPAMDTEASGVSTDPDLDYWITIQESVVYSPKIGSLGYEQVLNGRSSLVFIMLDPAPVPKPGQTVKFIDGAKLRFGGFIQTVTLNTDQSEAVKEYTIDCVGWEGQLERHLIKSSYTDLPVQSLIPAAITDGHLDDDGFTAGQLDPGPPVLSLIDADYVRASDYLRDIATAGGGAIEISPEKVISFRKVDLRAAPFELTNAEAEMAQTQEDLDDYCNQVTVLVTGTSGATANITRADPAEISLRAAVEGTSGIYHVHERVNHPTSNDAADLGRLGVSVAFFIMAARGRVNKTFTAQLRRGLLEVGQLLTVDMPGMQLDGLFQINRLSITDEGGKLLYAIEATFTNKRYMNLESLLKIVGAAKTTVVVPDLENFTNTVTFTTLGAATWNVPGPATQNFQVEMDAIAAGGGGAGGVSQFLTQPGGSGGRGGRAVSFREYAGGTTLSLFIGTGGAAGAFNADGSNGGNSYVGSPTESRVVEGFGGGGGHKQTTSNAGVNGADGQATGDFLYPAGGSPGGQGGFTTNGGTAGTHGKIIIRY